jgi:DNA-binding XRE family transcriptional regulator
MPLVPSVISMEVSLDVQVIRLSEPSQLWRKEDTLALLDRLDAAMRLRRVNQTELAEMLDVRKATVSQWFSLERLPETEIFLKLPKVLGGDANWWHGMDGGKPPDRVPLHPIIIDPDDITRTG